MIAALMAALLCQVRLGNFVENDIDSTWKEVNGLTSMNKSEGTYPSGGMT